MIAIEPDKLLKLASYFGAALAVGMGAIGAGIGEGYAASESCQSASRQPRSADDILRVMLVGQAVTESAAIFALIIGFILLFVTLPSANLEGVAARISAGLCIGFGALSSGVGAGLVNAMACRGVGRRPDISTQLTVAMLIGQSVAQSSAIFALIVSLLLLFRPVSGMNIERIAALFGAGIAMGFGAVGPGIGTGTAGAFACYGIASKIKYQPVIMRIMLLGQAVSQSTAIYSLVIAMILMFIV